MRLYIDLEQDVLDKIALKAIKSKRSRKAMIEFIVEEEANKKPKKED